jgi:hypothetical protein
MMTLNTLNTLRRDRDVDECPARRTHPPHDHPNQTTATPVLGNAEAV